jgi:hypothetical protein
MNTVAMNPAPAVQSVANHFTDLAITKIKILPTMNVLTENGAGLWRQFLLRLYIADVINTCAVFYKYNEGRLCFVHETGQKIDDKNSW